MGGNPQIVYKDYYPVLGLPIDVSDINLTLKGGRVRPRHASYKGNRDGSRKANYHADDIG